MRVNLCLVNWHLVLRTEQTTWCNKKRQKIGPFFDVLNYTFWRALFIWSWFLWQVINPYIKKKKSPFYKLFNEWPSSAVTHITKNTAALKNPYLLIDFIEKGAIWQDVDLMVSDYCRSWTATVPKCKVFPWKSLSCIRTGKSLPVIPLGSSAGKKAWELHSYGFLKMKFRQELIQTLHRAALGWMWSKEKSWRRDLLVTIILHMRLDLRLIKLWMKVLPDFELRTPSFLGPM